MSEYMWELFVDLLIEERDRLRGAGREQAKEIAALRNALDAKEAAAKELEADLAAARGELRALKAPPASVGP